MAVFKKQIGIDLGSSYVRAFIPGKGVALTIPSVIAVDIHAKTVVACGNDAASFIGRSPKGIEVMYPIYESVITDYDTAQALLSYILDTVIPRWQIFKPDILLGAPSNISSTARKALSETSLKSGVSAVYIVKNPLLGALGSDIPVQEAGGHMLLDWGGGTVDIAILSLGGIVSSATIHSGGRMLDKAIGEYIRKLTGVVIGEKTAETLKITLGSAMGNSSEQKSMEVTGNDIITGLPRSITVSARDILKAIQPHLDKIVQAIKEVLHNTPPELAADIMDKGIILIGGGSLLPDLPEYIYKETHVSATLSTHPKEAVILGIGKALEHLDIYKRWLVR